MDQAMRTVAAPVVPDSKNSPLLLGLGKKKKRPHFAQLYGLSAAGDAETAAL